MPDPTGLTSEKETLLPGLKQFSTVQLPDNGVGAVLLSIDRKKVWGDTKVSAAVRAQRDGTRDLRLKGVDASEKQIMDAQGLCLVIIAHNQIPRIRRVFLRATSITTRS